MYLFSGLTLISSFSSSIEIQWGANESLSCSTILYLIAVSPLTDHANLTGHSLLLPEVILSLTSSSNISISDKGFWAIEFELKTGLVSTLIMNSGSTSENFV